MIEAMLNESQKSLRSEVRELVKAVPRQLLLDMDADKVRYPRQFLEEAAGRKLLGLRFSPEYGDGVLPRPPGLIHSTQSQLPKAEKRPG